MDPIQVMNEYALGFALTNCLFLSLLHTYEMYVCTGKGVVACVYVHTHLVLYICMRRKREQYKYKYKHIK